MWYLSERLQWCVTELSRSLSDGVTDEPNNSFVHLMDLAVQQVDRDRTILPTTVHDLVRQAVTIAKLALPTDCKEINLSCQKVNVIECCYEVVSVFHLIYKCIVKLTKVPV